MNSEQKKYLEQLLELGDINYIRNTKENIVNAISKMDIDLLWQLLDDDLTYQDVSKENFIKELGKKFHKFKIKDTELIPYEGTCISKNCSNKNKKGIQFVGNNSGNYLSLIFEQQKNGVVKDICYCSQFCSTKEDISFENNEAFSISFYQDEKANFTPSSRFNYQNNKALEALSELEVYENTIVPLNELIQWRDKHQSLYDDFIWSSLYKNFSKFFNSFFHVNELLEFTELETIGILAVEDYDSLDLSDEVEFLRWLVKYEKFHNDTGLLGWTILSEESSNEGKHQIDSTLNIYFETKYFKNTLKVFDLFSQNYYDMIEKYSVISNEERDQLDPKSEIYGKILNLSYHLRERGII